MRSFKPIPKDTNRSLGSLDYVNTKIFVLGSHGTSRKLFLEPSLVGNFTIDVLCAV